MQTLPKFLLRAIPLTVFVTLATLVLADSEVVFAIVFPVPGFMATVGSLSMIRRALPGTAS